MTKDVFKAEHVTLFVFDIEFQAYIQQYIRQKSNMRKMDFCGEPLLAIATAPEHI